MRSMLILCCLIALSCSSFEKTDEKIQADVTTAAIANVHSSKYPNIEGTVSFTNQAQGIKIIANLSGLPKKAYLGFHIHENGACEGPDYKSAGDHYNPTSAAHGGPGNSSRHFGDLGNLITDAKGETQYQLIIPKNSDADFEKIIGKSILIHAKRDDLKSPPSGNAGARIACGIIKPIDSKH